MNVVERQRAEVKSGGLPECQNVSTGGLLVFDEVGECFDKVIESHNGDKQDGTGEARTQALCGHEVTRCWCC